MKLRLDVITRSILGILMTVVIIQIESIPDRGMTIERLPNWLRSKRSMRIDPHSSIVDLSHQKSADEIDNGI